jgi:GNAT superfamily N-acetyltransferase
LKLIFQQITSQQKTLPSVIKLAIGNPTVEKTLVVLNDYDKINNHLIVCLYFNKLIGVIGFTRLDRICIIKHIAVLEEYQSIGIGKKLIYEMIKTVNPLLVSAETDNDSVNFYHKCGFECMLKYDERYSCKRYHCIYTVNYMMS